MTLSPGDPAPSFSLPDDSGAQVALDDYAGRRLVVYFYPKAFTPGCTTEACDFRDHHESFLAAGYDILGISPDPPERLADFRRKYSLPFKLLSDSDHEVAAAYGAWGKRPVLGQGLIRSTFVVGPNGLIEEAWYGVKAGGHVERTLEGLTAGGSA